MKTRVHIIDGDCYINIEDVVNYLYVQPSKHVYTKGEKELFFALINSFNDIRRRAKEKKLKKKE